MIESKDVEYVAWLARLDLSGEEKERFTRQLGQVLEHAELAGGGGLGLSRGNQGRGG